MHLARTLALIFLASAAAFGQTTWQGLIFGSRPAQAQATLSKKSFRLVRLDAASEKFKRGHGYSEWEAAPVFDLKASNSKMPFHFTPNLIFDRANKLDEINLMLATEQRKAEGTNAGTLALIADTTIETGINRKYGQPLSEKGACESVSASALVGGSGQVQCSATWKQAKQIISLEWEYFEGQDKLFFTITYKPIVQNGL